MSDDEPQTRITLRLPASLHGDLTSAAAISNRSMNAEIVQRLETSFRLSGLVDDLQDAYKIVDEGHDEKNKLMQRMVNLYEAQKLLSDQQQAIIEQLFKALPELQDKEDQQSKTAMKTAVQPKKAGMQLSDPADFLRAVYAKCEVEPPGPATPSIPGVNAPKRGLGAAPKSEKPKQERVQTTKKKVFVKTDNTKDDHS